MKKRVLSAVLAFAMVLALVPGLSFAASAAEPVRYIERTWDGEKIMEKEKDCSDYIVVNAGTETIGGGKWYVVNANTANEHRIMVDGTANLILVDGCRLDVYGGLFVSQRDTLNIYGQRGDSGVLTAYGSTGYAAIGGNSYGNGGTVAIHGGTVEAKGGTDAAGIGGGYAGDGGNVTVYGGTVSAAGGYSDGAGIGGGRFGNGKNVAIYGGVVTASSGGAGRAIGAGYEGRADGTLTVADYARVKAGEEAPGTDTTLTEYLGKGDPYLSVSAPFVNYIERSWSGEKVTDAQKSCTDFILVDEDTATFDGGNWYVVKRNIDSGHRINTWGTVNLILCDGCTFTTNGGLFAPAGSTLNIYSQSNGTGKLTAYGTPYGAAIGSSSDSLGGTLNIHGGTIRAIGGDESAGIGGGYNSDGSNVTVYGGSVTAGGSAYGAAIGGGYRGNGGSLTVYGGTVTAASSCRAIGAGSDGESNGHFTVVPNAVIKAGSSAPDTETTAEDCLEKGYYFVSVTVLEPEPEDSSVEYVERIWDGETVVEETKTAEALPITADMPRETRTGISVTSGLYSFDVIPLDGGWYYVDGDVSVDYRLIANGTDENPTRIILKDGCRLEALHGIEIACSTDFSRSLIIYGQQEDTGTLAASASEDEGAAIGENDLSLGNKKGNLTISGGTVIARQNGANQAAIGGSGRSFGTVTINGGTVSATASNGAAIGGGNTQSSGEIIINGGTVTAESVHGAGIGGGRIGSGNVTVNGGMITAGSDQGAGIGGGSMGAGGTLTVNGGTVTAASTEGAGIGGGFKADGGTVTVNGGTVTASSQFGAGIGGGNGPVRAMGETDGAVEEIHEPGGKGGTVTVNGGTVTATGGKGADGIGSSVNCEDHGTLTICPDAAVKAGNAAPGEETTADEYIQNRNQYVNISFPESEEKPVFEFVSKNLALDSAFAFNFYGKLNDENPDENAFMEFKIGSVRTVELPLADAEEVGDGRLLFPCYLNVLELDETIKAIFHDGSVTVERPDPLSVTEYLGQVLQLPAYAEDEKTVRIVRAISNYAHYAQLALDETHDEYTVGEGGDYVGTAARTDITLHTAEDLTRYAAVKTTADGFTAVKSVSRSLVLDHETAIVVYLTPASADYVPDVAVTDEDGGEADFTCEKQTNGKWKIVIRGVAAHMLGSTYTVSVDDGAMELAVSALSYAYSVLNSEKSDTQKLAAQALFEYCKAAEAFLAD